MVPAGSIWVQSVEFGPQGNLYGVLQKSRLAFDGKQWWPVYNK